MLQPVFKKEQYRLKRSLYLHRTYKYGYGRKAFEAKLFLLLVLLWAKRPIAKRPLRTIAIDCDFHYWPTLLCNMCTFQEVSKNKNMARWKSIPLISSLLQQTNASLAASTLLHTFAYFPRRPHCCIALKHPKRTTTYMCSRNVTIARDIICCKVNLHRESSCKILTVWNKWYNK